MNWIERRVIQRLWKRGYHLISETRIREAEDVVGPRIIGHRCSECGGKEAESSPSYVQHTAMCEASARVRLLRKILFGWPY